MVLSSDIAAAMVGSRNIKVQYRRINLDKKLFLTRLTYNCAHLRSTKESLTLEGSGWYLVALGQYGAILVDL